MLLILTYRRIVIRNFYIKTGVNVRKLHISVPMRLAFVTRIRQMIAIFYVCFYTEGGRLAPGYPIRVL